MLPTVKPVNACVFVCESAQCTHKLHKPIPPPYTPPPHPFRARTQNPPLRSYLYNIGKLIRRLRRRISLKRVKSPSPINQPNLRRRISLKHVKHLSPIPPPIHDCDAVGGAFDYL
jgi:hypothetical protein